MLDNFIDSIRAIAVDLKVAGDGSKLLRIGHDQGILLVYLPNGFDIGKRLSYLRVLYFTSSLVPKENSVRKLLEGYNVYKVGVDILGTFPFPSTLVFCIKRNVATFAAIEESLGFLPVTGLELSAFARRVRPMDFPTDHDARTNNLVAVLNGRALAEGLPDAWIASPSFDTSRSTCGCPVFSFIRSRLVSLQSLPSKSLRFRRRFTPSLVTNTERGPGVARRWDKSSHSSR